MNDDKRYSNRISLDAVSDFYRHSKLVFMSSAEYQGKVYKSSHMPWNLGKQRKKSMVQRWIIFEVD